MYSFLAYNDYEVQTMGIGKKDNSIWIEDPFDHDDFDKNPKSTVSFQPTIELVEQGRLGTAASPSNLVYALVNGKTVLIDREVPEVKTRVQIND